jgi:hypothetical protein
LTTQGVAVYATQLATGKTISFKTKAEAARGLGLTKKSSGMSL